MKQIDCVVFNVSWRLQKSYKRPLGPKITRIFRRSVAISRCSTCTSRNASYLATSLFTRYISSLNLNTAPEIGAKSFEDIEKRTPDAATKFLSFSRLVKIQAGLTLVLTTSPFSLVASIKLQNSTAASSAHGRNRKQLCYIL